MVGMVQIIWQVLGVISLLEMYEEEYAQGRKTLRLRRNKK